MSGQPGKLGPAEQDRGGHSSAELPNDSRPPIGGVPPEGFTTQERVMAMRSSGIEEDPMKEREDRIWNELMKLPKGMLQAMYLSLGRGALDGNSKAGLASHLSLYLAKLDFMR